MNTKSTAILSGVFCALMCLNSYQAVAETKFEANPVIALTCGFVGATVVAIIDLRVFQNPSNERYYAVVKTNYKISGRVTLGEPKVFPASKHSENSILYWADYKEEYIGMQLSKKKSGKIVDFKTGIVTSIEEVNGQMQEGYKNECNYEPNNMNKLWLTE